MGQDDHEACGGREEGREEFVVDTTAIIVHVLAAIPPTVAAVAALVTAIRTKRDTQRIKVIVNGRLDRLQSELDAAKTALAKKDHP